MAPVGSLVECDCRGNVPGVELRLERVRIEREGIQIIRHTVAVAVCREGIGALQDLQIVADAVSVAVGIRQALPRCVSNVVGDAVLVAVRAVNARADDCLQPIREPVRIGVPVGAKNETRQSAVLSPPSPIFPYRPLPQDQVREVTGDSGGEAVISCRNRGDLDLDRHLRRCCPALGLEAVGISQIDVIGNRTRPPMRQTEAAIVHRAPRPKLAVLVDG